MASTIPLVISGLTPSLKLFLYSMTSSDNVPLTWPYCLRVWHSRHDNGPLDHGYDTWHDFLHPPPSPPLQLESWLHPCFYTTPTKAQTQPLCLPYIFNYFFREIDSFIISKSTLPTIWFLNKVLDFMGFCKFFIIILLVYPNLTSHIYISFIEFLFFVIFLCISKAYFNYYMMESIVLFW